ncbi:MAG: hypothetical protein M3P94_04635 [Chloroflexota bacterium]|nr:hypothetical protein [Chloroflexota bacterium]
MKTPNASEAGQMAMLDLLEELIELMDETGVSTREQAILRLAELEAALGDEPGPDEAGRP